MAEGRWLSGARHRRLSRSQRHLQRKENSIEAEFEVRPLLACSSHKLESYPRYIRAAPMDLRSLARRRGKPWRALATSSANEPASIPLARAESRGSICRRFSFSISRFSLNDSSLRICLGDPEYLRCIWRCRCNFFPKLCLRYQHQYNV